MLRYPPKPGTLVICDYSTGFREPEMVKKRLAVVVSPRLPHRDWLCTVVPLSTTPPAHRVAYQCKITLSTSPPKPFEGVDKWAKADMLFTAAYGPGGRLDLPHTERDKATGRRQYLTIVLDDEMLERVRTAVLSGLGIFGEGLKS